MSLLNTYSLTVTRKAPGSYVNGIWVDGSSSTFSIQTSWQPASGRDLESLEEGMRQKAVFKGYPSIEVKTVDPKSLQVEDVITGPDGKVYRIVFVGPWQNNLIPHYKFMALRDKEGA